MNQPEIAAEELIAQHVTDHSSHRFNPVLYRGVEWDLGHLDPFAFKIDIGGDRHVVVVVLFSCHCFTHKLSNDPRAAIPADEIYSTSQEDRILNEERYQLSKTLLVQIVQQLHQRHITVADEGRNFVTFEKQLADGALVYYGVFFEVSRDKRRGGRIILRVQSAYILPKLTYRQKEAKKVRFAVLIRAVYEGRTIRA